MLFPSIITDVLSVVAISSQFYISIFKTFCEQSFKSSDTRHKNHQIQDI